MNKIVISDQRVCTRGQSLYRHAKSIIPGGTQLLSKRPEMFAPNKWPAYYEKAKGVLVTDIDGNDYIDMSIMSVGACILGYADDDVDSAVIDAIQKGVSSSLNCSEEVKLADLLLGIHPWFDMVRFARSGGEAMSIAVRIARASSKKDKILFSGYHGWCDWYLAANLSDDSALDGQLMPGLSPNGVPRGLSGTAIPFNAGDIDQLARLFHEHKDCVASVVIEPARGLDADDNYLSQVRALCDQNKSVLIFDEITSGFRMSCGGLHTLLETKPDIAVFAKSMANGYPMAAIIGTGRIMDAAQTTFISSTNWTDRVGPAAALATIQKYAENQAHRKLLELGKKMKSIWQSAAENAGLSVKVTGIDSLPAFGLDGDFALNKYSYYVARMLDAGFLGFRQFKPSFSHEQSHLNDYEKVVRDCFNEIASGQIAWEDWDPCHVGFHRLTRE